ncbi:hypothetical protein C2I36_13660, partial [Rhodobacteraceae bacterium WD3A24]
FDAARGAGETHPAAPAPAAAAPEPSQTPRGPRKQTLAWEDLVARAAALPPPAREMAQAGLRKVVDFQDTAYGREYLDRLERVLAADDEGHGYALTREAAKYIANAMAYDDMIRVADRKTRPGRFARIRAEMGVDEGKVMQLTEFTHPRAQEVVSLFPAGMGRWCEARPRLMGWIDRRVNKGRRLRSDGLWSFLQLYMLGGLRFWRRRTLRHAQERAHLQEWLDRVLSIAARDYALGVEAVRARRLIKGYSDTHARGLSKFDRVMDGIAAVEGREDAADWARRLREAALADEKGEALDGALKTIRSFA